MMLLRVVLIALGLALGDASIFSFLVLLDESTKSGSVASPGSSLGTDDAFPGILSAFWAAVVVAFALLASARAPWEVIGASVLP
jgi:hypothetical protein